MLVYQLRAHNAIIQPKEGGRKEFDTTPMERDEKEDIKKCRGILKECKKKESSLE